MTHINATVEDLEYSVKLVDCLTFFYNTPMRVGIVRHGEAVEFRPTHSQDFALEMLGEGLVTTEDGVWFIPEPEWDVESRNMNEGLSVIRRTGRPGEWRSERGSPMPYENDSSQIYLLEHYACSPDWLKIYESRYKINRDLGVLESEEAVVSTDSEEAVVVVTPSEVAQNDVEALIDELCGALGTRYLYTDEAGDLRFEDATDEELQAASRVIGAVNVRRSTRGRAAKAPESVIEHLKAEARYRSMNHLMAAESETATHFCYRAYEVMKTDPRPILCWKDGFKFLALPSDAPDVIERIFDHSRRPETKGDAHLTVGKVVARNDEGVEEFVRRVRETALTISCVYNATRFWVNPKDSQSTVIWRYQERYLADARMYERQREETGTISFSPYHDETIGEYAHRIYIQIARQNPEGLKVSVHYNGMDIDVLPSSSERQILSALGV